ncbi:MAG: BolA family transcriptional regulator [Gammaproteobacteria bacterium]|nr:BolA family transcriptional regulator [Gammaproteobacteria bacterium]MCP5423813.1 BolA family transcriptional regulator [Gammaproteobacteria bacterium]
MSVRVALLEQRLRAALAPSELQIIDDSAAHAGHAGARSGGGHFNLLIVSDTFVGQSRLQRHRLVYQAVGDLMEHEIHALSIRALAPDEL